MRKSVPILLVPTVPTSDDCVVFCFVCASGPGICQFVLANLLLEVLSLCSRTVSSIRDIIRGELKVWGR